jgi:hypothetical protein
MMDEKMEKKGRVLMVSRCAGDIEIGGDGRGRGEDGNEEVCANRAGGGIRA